MNEGEMKEEKMEELQIYEGEMDEGRWMKGDG